MPFDCANFGFRVLPPLQDRREGLAGGQQDRSEAQSQLVSLSGYCSGAEFLVANLTPAGRECLPHCNQQRCEDNLELVFLFGYSGEGQPLAPNALPDRRQCMASAEQPQIDAIAQSTFAVGQFLQNTSRSMVHRRFYLGPWMAVAGVREAVKQLLCRSSKQID